MNNILEAFKVLSKDTMEKQLKEWDIAYYEKDAPLISDEDYDLCVAYYKEFTKEQYNSSLGMASDAFKKYKHPYQVASLNKINTKSQYLAAVKKFDNSIIIEPKLDGLTVVYYPDGKLVSRGDGFYGEILPYAHLIPNLPKPLNKPVRMEVFMNKSVYDIYFKDSGKNSRNVVAGILRRKEYTDDIKFLNYNAYNILDSDDKSEYQQLVILRLNNFNIVDFMTINNYDAAERIYDSLESYSKDRDVPTDGIVIKYNAARGLAKYGVTAHHPNNMIAYKFQSLVKETTLKDIRWSRGKSKLTPVAIFDSVELGSNTITAASLHNLNIMNKLNVKIGSKIMVTLKNEIIPQIISSNGEGTDIVIPTECPVCGHKLEINDSQELICPNKNCSMNTISILKRMCSDDGLGIIGLGPKNIQIIYDKYSDILDKNPFDLLHMTPNMLKEAGFTDYTAMNLNMNIISGFSKADLAHILSSCNIKGLGLNKAKKIAAHFKNPDDFIKNFKIKGIDIDSVGEVLYSTILDNMELIKTAAEYITFEDSDSDNHEKEYRITEPKIFAITGTLSRSKSDVARILEHNGHQYSASVTKKVNYLVVGDDPGKDKTDKAKKYNIPMINEERLKEMLVNHE